MSAPFSTEEFGYASGNLNTKSQSPKGARSRIGRIWTWSWRTLVAFAVAGLVFGLIVLIQGYRAFGQGPEGERLRVMEASPQWHEGRFINARPLQDDFWGMVGESSDASPYATPVEAVRVQPVAADRFARAPQSGLRVTWLGHSTTLIEIDGLKVLTDPVWGERVSPLEWLGPARYYAPPLALEDLPELDAVVISHDHYDHLDYPTIVALAQRGERFVVPLGVGAHLEYWGVAPDHIVELDWWERSQVRDLEVVLTPARHSSGRHVFDRDRTLWGSYAIVGPQHRVFFSGDTGMFPELAEIGRRFGPFDLTMLEVGQYAQSWPDWHLGPEQAVRAHQLLRGRVLLPVHWGLFQLAPHAWTEPIERVLVAAEARGVEVIAPRPGQSLEPSQARAISRWWPERPFRTAQEYPVVSTHIE